MAKKSKDEEKKVKRGKAKAEAETSRKKKVKAKVKEEAETKKKKRKVEEDDEPEEKPAKKGKGKKAKAEADDGDEGGFNPYVHIGATLDEVAKKLSDADTLDDMQPMSSGSLSLDLVLGGGIRAAWYTHFGPEQSAKTTGALLILASSVKHKLPMKALRDFEGSTGNSVPYVASIMKTNGVNLSKDELFGKKAPETGKWLIPPVIRYSASTKGVSFFNWFASVLRRLPDKKMLNGEWWLVYDDDKENQPKYGKYGDKDMARKYGKGIYIKAPDGGLQGLVVLDSYPNMNPDMKDEDEGDNSLALQARMFSKNLPRVKGYLASKKVAVIGINQLRQVPMAMYGPSETEPCGTALRYNSDVRLRWYPRSVDSSPYWAEKSKKGGFEIERALDGGKDQYKYIHVSAFKNKLSEGGREAWIRLWTKDSQKVAHGIDPVFDTIYYLENTGQLYFCGSKAKRDHIKLDLGCTGELSKEVTWMDVKAMILGDKEAIVKAFNKAGLKPRKLRDWCFKQMASGQGEQLFKAKEERSDKAASTKPPSDDDGDDE